MFCAEERHKASLSGGSHKLTVTSEFDGKAPSQTDFLQVSVCEAWEAASTRQLARGLSFKHALISKGRQITYHISHTSRPKFVLPQLRGELFLGTV